MLRIVSLVLCVCALAGPAAGEDKKPAYPAGRSSQQIEGLAVELGVPEKLSAEQPASLIVVLHGAGGSATGMAAAVRAWIPDGYVVCAPKSSGQVWSESDVGKVKKVIQKLQAELPIDKAKLHVVGFSNGGWSLPPLAFDDELKPRTATWVASGCRAASPPKWASSMGVLALAGTKDANASSARSTVAALYGKVGVVEARFQPDLGHEWPRALMPYFQWWTGAREGRFTPGVDMNFAWGSDISAALEEASQEKKGAVLVYAFDPDDTASAAAKALQNDIFMDPLARHYGGQLHPTKVSAKDAGEALAAYGVKSYPAVLILKKDGKVKALLQGKKLTKRKVFAALRSAAPNKKKPEGL